jgi:hypothetical protein
MHCDETLNDAPPTLVNLAWHRTASVFLRELTVPEPLHDPASVADAAMAGVKPTPRTIRAKIGLLRMRAFSFVRPIRRPVPANFRSEKSSPDVPAHCLGDDDAGAGPAPEISSKRWCPSCVPCWQFKAAFQRRNCYARSMDTQRATIGAFEAEAGRLAEERSRLGSSSPCSLTHSIPRL